MTHYIYALAASLGLLSFLMTNMLALRCFATFAASCFILAGFFWGNHSMIAWNFASLAINCIQIVLIFLAKKPLLLPSHLKSIYPYVADAFTTRELFKIASFATMITIEPKTVLVTEQSLGNGIYIVLDGTLAIVKNKSTLIKVTKGTFIGEQSYLDKKPTNATVISQSIVHVLHWNNEVLEITKKKKPDLFKKLHTAISLGLSRKIETTNELLSYGI
jgi:hypothetical protein